MMAEAFASRARSLSAERRPRMSAIQRSLPWAVSNTFVWVFTWKGGGRELGEEAGRVDVDAGRDAGCIFDGTRRAK